MNKKFYTPQEVIQEIAKSLKSKLQEHAKLKAKKAINDLEDEDNIPELDTSISPEKRVLNKAKVDDVKYGKEKVGDSSIATRAMKHNDRQNRAHDLDVSDRKRYEKTSERLKEKKYNQSLNKSNYGPKGAGQYTQADNERRKNSIHGNVGDISSEYSSVKMKTGANATGGQGKRKFDEDMKKLKTKNKKQPVTSLKDMSPEKQAKLKELYETKMKKGEKLKNLLEKIHKKK
jgi:hypothetical protein